MTKKKKSKQAPKGTWRYGIVKRTYKTIIGTTTGGVSRYSVTCYEPAEVYNSGKSWSTEARAIIGGSKRELIEQMKKAIKDFEKYDVIVEKKPIVHDMRRKK